MRNVLAGEERHGRVEWGQRATGHKEPNYEDTIANRSGKRWWIQETLWRVELISLGSQLIMGGLLGAGRYEG